VKRLLLFLMTLAALGAGCDALGLGDDEDNEAFYLVRTVGEAGTVAIAYADSNTTLRDTLRGESWSHQVASPSTMRMTAENLSTIPNADPPALADSLDRLSGFLRLFIMQGEEAVARDSTLKDTTVTLTQGGAMQDSTLVIGTPSATVEHEF
jgi:hypothetical protein